MPRRTLVLLLLAAACGHGTGVAPGRTDDALRRAVELREGCVASHFAVFSKIADFAAPLTAVRSRADLAAFAAAAGCELTLDEFDGEPFTLLCRDVPVDGDIVIFRVELLFLVDGHATADLDRADALDLRVEVDGTFSFTEADLRLRADPARGVVLEGTVATVVSGFCAVEATVRALAGRLVADLPDVPVGLVFLAGDVDLAVREAGRLAATGGAALTGRSAVVVLEVDGIVSEGVLELGY